MYNPQTRIIRNNLAFADFSQDRSAEILSNSIARLAEQGMALAMESRERKRMDESFIQESINNVPVLDAKAQNDLIFSKLEELKSLRGKSAFSKEYRDKMLEIRKEISEASAKSQQDAQKYAMIRQNMAKDPYITKKAYDALDIEYTKPMMGQVDPETGEIMKRDLDAFYKRMYEVDEFYNLPQFVSDKIADKMTAQAQVVEQMKDRVLMKQYRYNPQLGFYDEKQQQLKRQMSEELKKELMANPKFKMSAEKSAQDAYGIYRADQAMKGLMLPDWEDLPDTSFKPQEALLNKKTYMDQAADKLVYGETEADNWRSLIESVKFMPSQPASQVKMENVEEEDRNIAKTFINNKQAGLDKLNALARDRFKEKDGRIYVIPANAKPVDEIIGMSQNSFKSFPVPKNERDVYDLIKVARTSSNSEKAATVIPENPERVNEPAPQPKKMTWVQWKQQNPSGTPAQYRQYMNQ